LRTQGSEGRNDLTQLIITMSEQTDESPEQNAQESQGSTCSAPVEDIRDYIPKYKSHKKVHAAPVTGITLIKQGDHKGGAVLHLTVAGRKIEHRVSAEYMTKHDPQSGGYFVIYEDGYESWSPEEAFKGGYEFANKTGFEREELESIRNRAYAMCDLNPRTDLNARAACVRYENLGNAAEAVHNAAKEYDSYRHHMDRLIILRDEIEEALSETDDADTEALMEFRDRHRDVEREIESLKQLKI